MNIVISFSHDEPPAGSVIASGLDDGVDFVGWLGLLRALAELLRASHRSPEPD